jgi:two-component system chemotaxis response regulator CheY
MGKTILVADDNAEIRSMIRFTLQFKGYTVIEAEDGKAAFEILQRQPCDLLVSDIDMPNVSGLELLRKVRQELGNEQLPIIICSGEREVDEQDVLRRGANRMMPKPFSPVKLMEAVQSLV